MEYTGLCIGEAGPCLDLVRCISRRQPESGVIFLIADKRFEVESHLWKRDRICGAEIPTGCGTHAEAMVAVRNQGWPLK